MSGPYVDVAVMKKHFRALAEASEGREWHRTETEAKARANEMVRKKIRSLDKQRAAMLRLVF